MKRGSMRWDEQMLREHAARNARFSTAVNQSQGSASEARRPHKPHQAGSTPALATPTPPAPPPSAAGTAVVRVGAPLERDVLKAVLQYLEVHPRVAWAARMNTGGMERTYNGETRFVAFGFTGCSDIIGQLKDGRFLAVECKRTGRNPTPAQGSFIAKVNRNGGLAFVARNPDDIKAHIG